MKFTHFDGVSVTANDAIEIRQRMPDATRYQVDHRFQRRSRQYPVLEDVTYNELRPGFTVIAHDADSEDVFALLSVYGGMRELRGIEGETTFRVMADVANIQRAGNSQNMWHGEFVTNGVFESDAEAGPQTDSPITIEGNLHALPEITFTGGGDAATRHRYSIRDRTGRGLKSWDVRIDNRDATEVWVHGVSIPFAVVNGHTWFRVGVRHDRPTLVDLITGGVASPMKDTLDTGNMILSQSTNTQRVYGSGLGWFTSQNPGGASNQWRPGVVDALSKSQDLTYRLDEDYSGSEMFLSLARIGSHRFQMDNDASALVFISPVEMTKITGLTRILRTHALWRLEQDGVHGTFVQGFVKYLRPEQERWSIAWSETVKVLAPQFPLEKIITIDINIEGAVVVAVGLSMPEDENETSHYHLRGSLEVQGTPTVHYDPARVPEISHLGSVSGRYIQSGALINQTTGQEIRFQNVYFDADGLVIDCNRLDINAVTGMHFGDITETDPAHLFRLVRGNNHWMTAGDLSGAIISFQWSERFVV